MPEVVHRAALSCEPERVWAFVRDMDHWAPFLLGYQRHEARSESLSEWTLRGDLGMLSREVRLRVEITEWVEQERVRFELEGLNEPLSGEGRFTLRGSDPPQLPAQRSWWRRLFDWLLRRPQPAPQPAISSLELQLQLEVGGPMGPMVNALLQPWLEQFASRLATRIATHLSDADPTD